MLILLRYVTPKFNLHFGSYTSSTSPEDRVLLVYQLTKNFGNPSVRNARVGPAEVHLPTSRRKVQVDHREDTRRDYNQKRTT